MKKIVFVFFLCLSQTLLAQNSTEVVEMPSKGTPIAFLFDSKKNLDTLKPFNFQELKKELGKKIDLVDCPAFLELVQEEGRKGNIFYNKDIFNGLVTRASNNQCANILVDLRSFILSIKEKEDSVKEQVTISKAYVFIPSLYQFKTGQNQSNTKQKIKGGLILGGQIVSVASIFISQEMANQANRNALLNKNNTSQYLSYVDSEQNWLSARNWSIGIAVGIYAYNLIDGLVYKEPEKMASRNWRVYPMASYNCNGFSLICKF